jgi:glycosyltransferase involved in cell wall biosynthesis
MGSAVPDTNRVPSPEKPSPAAGAEGAPLRVLVVLPRHLDVDRWAERFSRGEVPDETPYGYHFARRMGCEVSFCRATPTPAGIKGWVDRAFRKVLGFDLRHIWANRDLIASGDRFDVAWTHTENEHLAIGLLRKLGRPERVPPLIAQSIWLIDEWPRWSVLRRAFYRYLLKGAEILSFHSPLNAEQARHLKLGRRVEVVEFGISLDSFPARIPPVEDAPLVLPPAPVSSPSARPVRQTRPARPLRVLALGNDRHRDWACLAEALGGRSGYELRVGSFHFPASCRYGNIQAGPMAHEEVLAAYAWADCSVLPLRPNLHVSGMTSMMEAVAMKVPVLAARAGGLPHYFDDACVGYYDAGRPEDLRRALDEMMAAPATARAARVRFAQQTLLDRRFTSEGFAWRHVQLSHTLRPEKARGKR